MSDIPIEIKAARVWGGTKWHFPYIEKIEAENTLLQSELAAAIKERDEARIRYCASMQAVSRKGSTVQQIGREFGWSLPEEADDE